MRGRYENLGELANYENCNPDGRKGGAAGQGSGTGNSARPGVRYIARHTSGAAFNVPYTGGLPGVVLTQAEVSLVGATPGALVATAFEPSLALLSVLDVSGGVIHQVVHLKPGGHVSGNTDGAGMTVAEAARHLALETGLILTPVVAAGQAVEAGDDDDDDIYRDERAHTQERPSQKGQVQGQGRTGTAAGGPGGGADGDADAGPTYADWQINAFTDASSPVPSAGSGQTTQAQAQPLQLQYTSISAHDIAKAQAVLASEGPGRGQVQGASQAAGPGLGGLGSLGGLVPQAGELPAYEVMDVEPVLGVRHATGPGGAAYAVGGAGGAVGGGGGDGLQPYQDLSKPSTRTGAFETYNEAGALPAVQDHAL